MELEGRTLVLRRLHAHYTLRVGAGADRGRIERAHTFHADACPVARSIRAGIEISTSLDVVPDA